VPGQRPLVVRYRPQRARRWWHPCRRRLVLLARGKPVRQPAHGSV
ncbi:uncharacterized protein METZ01_LOCUS207437, partial [marine metagenome]